MANLLGFEVSWEAIQTALMWASRFRPQTPPAATSEAKAKEEPLGQQTTSILKPRNDEAIQLAIDAALLKTPGGLAHLQRVQAVREILKPHQRADWRKNIGTLVLTERFENILASETITRGNAGGQNQAAAGQPPRGQERTERKFERRPLDYEWTISDPRVRHLILVSKIVTAGGTERAKAYLLSAGLIAEQSPQEKAAATAKALEDKAAGSLYQMLAGEPAKAEVKRLKRAIAEAGTDADRQRLQGELRAYLVRQTEARGEETRTRNQNANKGFWIKIGFAFIVVVIIAAIAHYK